ncbi:SDR family oxidoreductase [Polyangium sp. y55x31]|uniref:SDR family oxidoreductase n=1 Tax=Polyangium sp. y55x31 TaxID=3042688 RepID=UPI0024823283|nr:SDR family oxidoreductase [Polyangium sp. y55x31]MDI1481373.1 SDR family oxidoreductase [Polyangium sp. y55x31]
MNKAALVTGAGKRIGRAIAMMLAREGFSVAVHYHRSREDAEHLVAAIESAGGRAAAVGANLADEVETGSLVDHATALVGPLVALVNNASTFEYDTPETATRETWDLHMEANLRAPFVLTQQFARRLPGGVEGAVVNVLDQRVWNLSPHYTTYTVSKAGLWALTQSLALALAPRIRVNAVGPGPTLPSTRQTPEQFAAQCESMPLRRGATPEDVCDAVRYLLTARAVTGQMIAVDGGQHLGWATPPPDSIPD